MALKRKVIGKFKTDANGNLLSTEEKKRRVIGKFTTDSDGALKPVSNVQNEDVWFKVDKSKYENLDAMNRTYLATNRDFALGLVEGVGNMFEGVVDLGAYVLSGGADLIGMDKSAENIKNWAKKGQVSNIVGDIKNEFNVEEHSILGNKADAIAQGLGQVGVIVGTGGIAGAAGLGSAGATALTTGLTFASSAGGGMSEAYQGGATDEEAVKYGLITGAADAGTELLFGGLGKATGVVGLSKGFSSLDDKLASKVSSKISNSLLKNMTQYGIKAGAEGTEEVLAGFVSALGKKATYMSEEDLGQLLEDEKLLDQFIAGTLISGIAQAGDVVISTSNGRDFVSGLTKNEQTVIDSVSKERIKEREANGTKLSTKEISKIEEQVKADLEKGRIDVDTIETILGGEHYTNYKKRMDSESKLQKEIAELRNLPESKITVGQRERLSEAKQELEELQKVSTQDLKNKLSSEVDSMTQNDAFIRESYNEKSRRSQTYTADVSKYDEGQRATIQNAIDSGILNDTRRTHEFVDMVARLSADKGVSFDFSNSQKIKDTGYAIEGKTVNGYVEGDKITLNINSAKALNKVVGHEITHVLEGTGLYSELQAAVKAYAESKGEYQSRLENIKALYKDQNANIENELTADLVGDYLFTDEDFINNLSSEQPGIFRKIYEEIKYLVKIATAGTKEAKQLEKVKRAFDKAYKENVEIKRDDNIKYNLVGTDENGIEIYETSEGVKKLSYSERNKLLLNSVLEDYRGRTAKFTKNGMTYYALYNEQGVRKGVYGDKKSDLSGRKAKTNIGADGNYIELAENALYVGTSQEQGKTTNNNFHEDAKTWDYYEKTIKCDGKYYDVLINVKDTGNEQYVYDITLKEASSPHRTNLYTRGKLASNDIIATSGENTSSNINYSFSGEYANNVNEESLAKAEKMEIDKVDAETIRLETGWHRGYDGKWRFEINDAEMEILDTSSNYILLGELIRHDKLFDAYPDLKNVEVVFEDLEKGVKASYNAGLDLISINNNTRDDVERIKSSLIHEIQHAIQRREGFSGGTNEHYWARRIEKGFDSRTIETKKKEAELLQRYRDISKNEEQFVKDMEVLKGMTPNVPRGTIDWNTLQQIEDDPIEWQQYDAERDRLSDKYGEDKVFDFMDLQYELSNIAEENRRSARDLYYDSAGEVEARDVAYRVGMSQQERIQHPPLSRKENVYKNNVVFPEYSLSSSKETSTGGYNIYGSDIAFDDDFPIASDLATPQEIDPKIRELAEALERQTEAAVDYEPDPDNFGQPIKTVADREAAKLENYKVELASKNKRRDTMQRQYNRDIAEEYDYIANLKDKNSVNAHAAMARIESLKTEMNNELADIDKSINALKERIKKMSTPEYKRTVQRQQRQQELRTEISEIMGDTTNWKDKKSGMGYKLHTLKRNLRDVIGDKKKADTIYRYLQGNYNQNEAKLNTESADIKKPYAEMNINKYEDQYIQMLGEYRYNPDTELRAEQLTEFKEKHKDKIDEKKVDKAIDMARDTYDDLFKRVNEVLREYGIKEIPYREGYFPHFTKEPQGIIAKLLNWNKEDNSIPTDIAGLTESFKPNKSYQSFSQHRTGDKTDYSFLEGLDRYTFGALDWIYHIGDIQKFRAFENEIRYRHSDDGVKEKVKAIEQDASYDADEAQAQIDALYAEKANPLNNLVQNIRTHTNLLAGKKNTMDRAMEENFNRNMYSVVKNASSRINANMVGGSISSALTNFIPITQSWSQVSPITSLKAMRDTLKSIAVDDGTIAKSTFLTNRLCKVDNLSKTAWDKVADKISIVMEGVDNFTSQTIWRSKYMENIEQGMSENEAILNADEFAEGVMAGRGRGNMPVIFESKNPITKIFTAFQLEVANQYDYMLKDMPTDMQDKSKAQMVKAYGAMFLGAYAYNALYSSLTGRDAAFDPIGIIQDILADLFDDEEDKPGDVIGQVIDAIGDEIPYVGGVLFDGGRIPLSSALPYGEGLIEAVKNTITDATEGNMTRLTKEWLNPLYYMAVPAGGGQLKKTIEGLSMFDDDLPIAGSYTDSGNLRFSVEDNLGSRIQAGLFGQWSSENAQAYIEDGRKPLSEKQLEEYTELNAAGMTMKEYWSYRDGIKKLKKQADKMDYIANLDVTQEQKNIMANHILERDIEIDLSTYEQYGDWAEFDYAMTEPEKYQVARAVGGYEKYAAYITAINKIESDKDENDKVVSGSRKKKVTDYINGLDISTEQKYVLYKYCYPADKKYNQQIVDYLNNSEDITSTQMKTILQELGFEIRNGKIYD